MELSWPAMAIRAPNQVSVSQATVSLRHSPHERTPLTSRAPSPTSAAATDPGCWRNGGKGGGWKEGQGCCGGGDDAACLVGMQGRPFSPFAKPFLGFQLKFEV